MCDSSSAGGRWSMVGGRSTVVRSLLAPEPLATALSADYALEPPVTSRYYAGV